MSREVVVEAGGGRLAGIREDGLCVFQGVPPDREYEARGDPLGSERAAWDGIL